jgi:hypothetical protein
MYTLQPDKDKEEIGKKEERQWKIKKAVER